MSSHLLEWYYRAKEWDWIHHPKNIGLSVQVISHDLKKGKITDDDKYLIPEEDYVHFGDLLSLDVKSEEFHRLFSEMYHQPVADKVNIYHSYTKGECMKIALVSPSYFDILQVLESIVTCGFKGETTFYIDNEGVQCIDLGKNTIQI